MTRNFFIIIFYFITLTSYSQRGKYVSYPCGYEMWDFLNDSVVFVRSGLGHFLFSYSIKSDTIQVKRISEQLLRKYRKQKKFKNMSINVFRRGYSEINTLYYDLANINNLLLIKKRKKY